MTIHERETFIMKQFKKMLLMMMCVCVMLGCVACGNNDAMDNGANQTDTTLDDANDNKNNMNDATDGTDDANGNGVVDDIGEGVEDIGDGIGQGVEDIGDGVGNALDGNDNADNNGNVGNNGSENKDVPKDSKK